MNRAAYGVSLDSELPLPELPPTDRPAELVILSGYAPPRQGWRPVADQFHDVKLWVHDGDGALGVHYPTVAHFEVDPPHGRIRVAASDGADESEVRHVLLDQIVPRLLVAQGALVLHASAVEVGSRAWLFAGASGVGKSTVAAVLAQRDARVLTDDVAVLDRCGNAVCVRASYPGLRLEDAASVVGPTTTASASGSKVRVTVGRWEPASAMVAGIVVLDGKTGSVRLEAVHGVHRVIELLAAGYTWPPGQPSAANLGEVTALAGQVDVWVCRSSRAPAAMEQLDELVRR